MPWKLKLDEESKAPVFQPTDKDGELPKPIYINSDGKEIALDPVSMYGKIIDMGKTEKQLRGDTKRLQGSLDLFTDIEDIAEWKTSADTALATVANYNDKEWMDVKKVEKLKEEMIKAHDDKVTQLKESFVPIEATYTENLGKKDVQIRKLMVSSKFATHPLFSGSNPKTNLPPEIAETYFGQQFKVEETDTGELGLVAYYSNGDQVYSGENPGELAGFQEAMFSIFEKYPGKDTLLKSSGGGSGGTGGTGGGDDGEEDKLKILQTQYEEAMKAKDSKLAIKLKNEIFRLQQAKAAA
jgi:hypothetical protein